MNADQRDIGIGFWLRWVIASFLGFAVGGMIGGFIMFAFHGELWRLGFAFFGPIFGAAGGIVQWFVLRQYIARSGGWVLATAVSYTLATVAAPLIFSLPYSDPAVAGMVTFAAVAGIVGGILQWLVLRRKIPHAGWWMLASILGLVLGMGIGGPVAMTLGQAGRELEATVVFGILFGVGVGAIPGAALVWLLKHPKSGLRAEAASQGAR
jgi:hypothetical protein